MTKSIQRILLTIALSLGLVAPLAVPVIASAATDTTPNLSNALCQGVALKIDNSCVNDSTSQNTVNNIIAISLNLFSLLVGIVAVIMIIVGGLKYITSGGESSNVTGAKNTILYAIVGLVIVALAQVIVRFVLKKTDAAITPTP